MTLVEERDEAQAMAKQLANALHAILKDPESGQSAKNKAIAALQGTKYERNQG